MKKPLLVILFDTVCVPIDLNTSEAGGQVTIQHITVQCLVLSILFFSKCKMHVKVTEIHDQ